MTKKQKKGIIIISLLIVGFLNLFLLYSINHPGFYTFLHENKIVLARIIVTLFLLGIGIFLEGAFGHLFMAHFYWDSLNSFFNISSHNFAHDGLYSSEGTVQRNQMFMKGVMLSMLVLFIGLILYFFLSNIGVNG